MEEIKVGEYIRTKSGCIFKATEYWLEECYSDRVNIKKHSKNIIDLIEEDDFVNGELVTKIKEWKSSKDGCFRYAVTVHCNVIRADEIEDVVTHEQFNQMKYIVGDE